MQSYNDKIRVFPAAPTIRRLRRQVHAAGQGRLPGQLRARGRRDQVRRPAEPATASRPGWSTRGAPSRSGCAGPRTTRSCTTSTGGGDQLRHRGEHRLRRGAHRQAAVVVHRTTLTGTPEQRREVAVRHRVHPRPRAAAASPPAARRSTATSTTAVRRSRSASATTTSRSCRRPGSPTTASPPSACRPAGPSSGSQHSGFAGTSWTFTGDNSNMINSGNNDAISSLRITRA